MRAVALLLAAVVLAGCSRDEERIRDYSTIDAKLPNGKTIKCEVMTTPTDMTKGMMFRDSLEADHGMLFFHSKPDRYKYWMWNVKIPLDIVWMDRTRRIVEISANTPPCGSETGKGCPNYGGNAESMYVLELAGGQAAKNGLAVGQQVQF